VKILLVNDNPVVTKLVTLSAQKTDDEVEIVHDLADIGSGEYDLIAVDDVLYSDDFFDKLKDKVSYKKSLYICSRDAESVQEFSSVIKKPFLPTDLVELFANIDRNLDVDSGVLEEEEEITELEDLEDLDTLEEIEDLDDDFLLDDLDENLEEEMNESVLDNDEAQKVKDLLDEEYDMALDLEDEADVDIGIDDDVEETQAKEEIEIEAEVASEEDVEMLDLEELQESSEEEISFDDEVALDSEALELDEIESQIETAVADLDDSELESEMDDEALLEIASNEINSLDELSSKDLKLALGEELDELEEVDEEVAEQEEKEVVENDGVEALKNLLVALSDKNVAASLKGAKITISISLGDN